MNIFNEIIDWVNDKPLFWKKAIYFLLTKNNIEENDIDELANLCKIEIGLVKGESPEINLDSFKTTNRTNLNNNKVFITKIKNVQNIKALKEGEELSFEKEGLTVIYGDNGSGKSSYAGILKHICKTRGTFPKLSKNIYKDDSSDLPQKAEVEFVDNTGENKTIKLENNTIDSQELKVIDIFDSNSASHYIEDEDEVAFLPSGLLVLEKLAACCQKVEQKIKNEIDVLDRASYDMTHLLEPDTEVSSFMKWYPIFGQLDGHFKFAFITVSSHAAWSS